MALTSCRFCGGMVSDAAAYCRHCGMALNDGQANDTQFPEAPGYPMPNGQQQPDAPQEAFGGEDAYDEEKPRKVWGYWVAIVILLAGAVTFGVLYAEKVKQLNTSESECTELQYKVSKLQGEKSTLAKQKQSAENALQSLKQKIGDTYPLIITDIEIANVYKGGAIETDYGKTLYSSRMMFLTPRIRYYGISAGTKNLKVKWYKPDGSLSTGTSSPYGFTMSDNYAIATGSNNTLTLNGWGNSISGLSWSPGTYRIEVWYGSTCLGSKSFTIYY